MHSPQQPLQALNILLTRNHAHSQSLKTRIQEYGGNCTSLPLVDIVPLQSSQTIISTIKNLKTPSLITITSRSAIEIVSQALKEHLQVATPHLWATLSPITGELLTSYGLPSVLFCKSPPYNSEALLSLLEKQSNLPKSSLVLCGKDGITVLEDYLQSYSNSVVILPLYERKMPSFEVEAINKIFGKSTINVILLTCVTAITHLVNLSDQYNFSIKQIPILAVSPRIQQAAASQGFQTIITCSAMTPQSITDKLLTWFPQYIKEIPSYG